MKIIDIIFALLCGKVIGFVVGNFLEEFGVAINIYYQILIWIAFPLFSLLCLQIAYLIGKRFLFVFQGAKFLLVGSFATVLDLKLFEMMVWMFSFFIIMNPLLAKGISFLMAVIIKYWGNKYWAFQKHEREDINREVMQFIAVTAIGLLLDVISFHYFTRLSPLILALPASVLAKIGVIFAALVAALWNFLGYKFLVFKK